MALRRATKIVATLGPASSDPDLLAMFVRPLVAWSGGNPTVTRIMDRTPWIQSLNPDQTTDAYSRTSSKRPPHDLVADVPRLYTYADQPPAVQVLHRHGEGEDLAWPAMGLRHRHGEEAEGGAHPEIDDGHEAASDDHRGDGVVPGDMVGAAGFACHGESITGS